MNLPQLTKRYYTISEVAKIFSVSNSLLRYWEKEFDKLNPVKGRNGVRRYTVKDVHLLNEIYQLVKERGFTIDGAKKELSGKRKSQTSEKETLLDRLGEIRERLVRLRDLLE